MTNIVHHPGGGHIMRGYASPGKNASKPQFAEGRVLQGDPG
jgi:hypothetical protein